MIPETLPFWDRLQLYLLRLLTITLALLDSLLHVDWGERILARLNTRWQAQLSSLDREISNLEAERQRLNRQAEALAFHAAVIYLGGRMLTQGTLIFDPSDPHDEEMLDASIDLLVKRQMAAIQPRQIDDQHYIYHLEPDWTAIHTLLTKAASEAEPELADWIREGLRFIATSFLVAAEA